MICVCASTVDEIDNCDDLREKTDKARENIRYIVKERQQKQKD